MLQADVQWHIALAGSKIKEHAVHGATKRMQLHAHIHCTCRMLPRRISKAYWDLNSSLWCLQTMSMTAGSLFWLKQLSTILNYMQADQCHDVGSRDGIERMCPEWLVRCRSSIVDALSTQASPQLARHNMSCIRPISALGWNYWCPFDFFAFEKWEQS